MQVERNHIEQVMRDAECLHSAAEVEAALDLMANSITAVLAHENPVLLCVMNGGLVPMGKILTRLNFPLQIDYLQVGRYGDQTTGGRPEWRVKPRIPLTDRVVLVIDDILDEGVTLRFIIDYLNQEQVKRVYTAVLVEKLHDRKQGLRQADFTGLKVEDKYVFGYGMDYKGFLRNAPGIFALGNIN